MLLTQCLTPIISIHIHILINSKFKINQKTRHREEIIRKSQFSKKYRKVLNKDKEWITLNEDNMTIETIEMIDIKQKTNIEVRETTKLRK